MSKEKIQTYRAKRKNELIYVMGGKCSVCGYDKCLEALEFHHINPSEKKFQLSSGDCRSFERDMEELRKCTILCANCHREIHFNENHSENLTSSFNEERYLELKQSKELPPRNTCEDCGKEITKGAKLCSDCSRKSTRKADRPTRELLKQLLRTMSFCEIGRTYNVSDNAVRKWCVSYSLPRTKTEIRKISNEDWVKI